MLRGMKRLVAVLTVIALTGCLGSAHRIPKRDLQGLAATPPEQRGDHVRVIQGFASEDQPPNAPRTQGNAVLVVHGPVHVGPHASHKPANKAKLGKIKAEKAEHWIILAALVAVGLAATEGARYDGWVKLHPMHPVHLYGPNGEYGWVPLAQLDAETAAWARKAYVRPQEGPWTELGRAPLNRRGWTYSVLLGGGEIPSTTGSTEAGFMSHIQLGHFPTKFVGVLFDIGLGWREDETANTVFNSRFALELQALPVSAGSIHAGGFGQFGTAARFDDGTGDDSRGALYGGGGLLQLEITTRLAITARAGLTKVHGETVSDFGLGLSIY
jgi:hypothetical protein